MSENSELKKVQREKEVLAQRLQSMFDRHAAVMLIIEPISGKIVDANHTACEFYGYSKEELQSKIVQMGLNKILQAEYIKFELQAKY